jgi:hypothetical protein
MSPCRTVNVTKLTPGDTLGEPVFSEGLTKLLGSGCAVSDQLIKRLAERGVTEVVVQIPADRTEKPERRVLPPSSIRPESVIDAPRLVEHSCQCGSVIAIHPLGFAKRAGRLILAESIRARTVVLNCWSAPIAIPILTTVHPIRSVNPSSRKQT